MVKIVDTHPTSESSSSELVVLNTSASPNLTVPRGTRIMSDGYPRLTHGGFVGSARVDPKYALVSKDGSYQIDARQLFPTNDSPKNPRRHKSCTMLRTHRQHLYRRRMALMANIPDHAVIVLPNGKVWASITNVGRHLLTTAKKGFGDVVDKLKSNLKVRITSMIKDPSGKASKFVSKLIDPMLCTVHNFDPAKEGFVQKDVQLEIPENVLFAAVPTELHASLRDYKARNNGQLSITLGGEGNGFWADFKRGFVTGFRGITQVLKGDIKGAVQVFKQEFGQDAYGNVTVTNVVYVMDNIDDLMEAIQNPKNVLGFNWRGFIETITPVVGPAVDIVSGLFSKKRSDGIDVDELNVIRVKNFTEACQREGYADINEYLQDFAAKRRLAQENGDPNFLSGLIKIIPGLISTVGGLFRNEIGQFQPTDEDEPVIEPYEIEPEDLEIVSMDSSGVGQKDACEHMLAYPINLASGSDPAEGGLVDELRGNYSIGNSIPRDLVWELDADFIDSGGNVDNVGEYLQYAEFDFSRIALSLVDANGFSCPCNKDVVTVSSFDSSQVGPGVAILKFVGQGTTPLTASFPYTIVSANINTMLSDTTESFIVCNSMINPSWIVNVVSDSNFDSTDYQDLCTLTNLGFKFDQPNTSNVGDVDVEVLPIDMGGVTSSVKFHVMDAPITKLTARSKKVKYYVSDRSLDLESIILEGETADGYKLYCNATSKYASVAGVKFGTEGKYTAEITLDSRMFGALCPKAYLNIEIEDPFVALEASSNLTVISQGSTLPLKDVTVTAITHSGKRVDVSSSQWTMYGLNLNQLGTNTITVKLDDSEYSHLFASFDVVVVNNAYKISRVTATTTKTSYLSGQTFEPETCTIIGTIGESGSTTVEIDPDQCVFSGTDFRSPGPKTVRGSLAGASDLKFDLGTINVERDSIQSITAEMKPGYNPVKFGKQLKLRMVNVRGVMSSGNTVPINDNVVFTGYDAKVAGTQDVEVLYVTEGGSTKLRTQMSVTVAEPVAIDMKVEPVFADVAYGTQPTPSDFKATLVTDDNIEVQLPPSMVGIADFDASGAKDQTGMATIQYPAEGTVEGGQVMTATHKFEVGEGGGSAVFELPALVVSVSKPYCYVGDSNPGFGTVSAYTLNPDGTMESVPESELQFGPVDTSKAGTVEITVTRVN